MKNDAIGVIAFILVFTFRANENSTAYPQNACGLREGISTMKKK